MKKKIIALDIICGLIIVLFMYTSTAKYIYFGLFVFDMHNQPFPHWLADALVWTLPPLEILVSLFLMFSKSRLIGLYSALMLMSFFTVYTALVLTGTFPRRPCSCGGVLRELTWGQHAVFNLFFLTLCIVAIHLRKIINKQPPVDSFSVA